MNLTKNILKLSASQQIFCRNASFLKSVKNFLKVEPYKPPYSHIVQIGDPCLRTPSDALPEDVIKSTEVIKLLNLMEKVRREYNLVGISAPQIGINLRIFLACFDKDNMKAFTPAIQKVKEMSLMPLTVFINPEIKVVDHRKIVFEEGCASVVGYAAEVARYHTVEVTAFNEKGEKKTQKYSGWNARIVQHELDHLNGIVFTDIMDRKTLRCTNWEVVNKKAGRIEIGFYPKKILD